jgi:deoxycytidylate deaminase
MLIPMTFTAANGWITTDREAPEWDSSKAALLSKLSNEVAGMSTCCKGHVGCVVTDIHLKVQAVGHNRKPPALEHLSCEQLGCDTSKKCRLTTHAEVDAFSQVEPRTDAYGHCLFLPKANCLDCLKHSIARGVRVVVFAKPYNIPEIDRWAYETILRTSQVRLFQLVDEDHAWTVPSEVIHLSKTDQVVFAEAIINPPPIPEALQRSLDAWKRVGAAYRAGHTIH